MAKRRIKENGFTLIELIIGIFIAFIIAWFGFMIVAGSCSMMFSDSNEVTIITQEQEAEMMDRETPISK